VIDPDIALRGNAGLGMKRNAAASAFQHAQIIGPITNRQNILRSD
jgi:hypothetical protein